MAFRVWRTPAMLGWLAFALLSHPADGSERVAVPITVQAEILGKLAAYDRNMTGRAAGRVNILILVKSDSPESRRAASQMQDALSALPTIAGYPHTEWVENYTNPAALAAECRAKRISIVFITPGFDDEVEALRGALEGLDIMSAAAVASYVSRGIVLGFDLVSGKPKMLVHLTQAKKQHVALSAEVLRLMTVYQ